MVWDDHKDDMLVREILLFEPFKFKQRTKERGNAWKMVADNLNEMDPEKFKVDQRGVRERFAVLKAHLEAKSREELRASGISPDHTALEQAIEDIIEQIREYEEKQAEEDCSKNEKSEREKEAAKDMRSQALETFAESKKRKDLQENDSKSKKSRSSGSDTIAYLREKAERETEFKSEEIALKKRKYDLLTAQQKASENQQQQMFTAMREQMELQKQQNLQMLALITQCMNSGKK